MGTKPLTASQIRAALTKWDVPHDYVDGWETRDNGGHWVIGSVADDVEGFMAHHTGDDASDSITRALLVKGRSDLSGPLCNFGITDKGTVDVIAAGSANHAGKGDPDTLAKVQSGDYTGNIYPDQHSSSTGSVPGNGRFYGAETYYGGGDDKTINALQYRVLILVGAAILDAIALASGASKYRSGKRFIGHKEWTDWKPDPAGVVMSDARADVQWCLTNGPAAARAWYDTGSKTNQEDDMPTVQEVVDGLLRADRIAAPSPSETNPTWTVASVLEWTNRSSIEAAASAKRIENQLTSMQTTLAAQGAALEALATSSGVDPSQIVGVVDKAVRDRLDRIVFDVEDPAPTTEGA